MNEFRLGYNFASPQCLAPCYHDDIAQLHDARMSLEKLTELGYETSLRQPYFLDLSVPFFKHLETFVGQKMFRSKGNIESVFNDFFASKPFEFHRTDIKNNLLINGRNA